MKTIELFQWDLNQKIPCQFPEVHFASIGSSDALIVSADGGNASIPNILLQEPKDIMVWFMRDDAVADSGKIRIIPRAKPADYVYTETEVITFESLVAKVEDVIAKANTAVDNATAAANKAEAAVSKLPLPLGNTLKGEVEATLVNVDDAYPAPLITTKVMGQSNQQQDPAPSPENPQEITNLNKAELVVAGKNLINPNRLAQIDSFYYQAVDGQLKVINPHNAAWKDVPIYGTLQAGTYTISGDNIEIRDAALNQIVNIAFTTPQVNQFTLENPTAIKMKVGFGLPKYPVITKAQLEVGSKATTYEPHKSKSTPIDLKGNELCSLPNGVKDEVVIDAEGNVSLIKRTKQYSWNCVQIINGTGRNYAVDKVLDIGANYTGLVAEKAINATNNDIGICYVNQKMIYVTVPESVTTKEQANQLYGGMKVIYQLAEPQTIPLGKVELPALPESTSNVWNNGNIPASVYINYLKDVNIAYGKLESQLSQMAMALSMMDTPTIIPEISEDEPTLIPELEESPIEESSITK